MFFVNKKFIKQYIFRLLFENCNLRCRMIERGASLLWKLI